MAGTGRLHAPFAFASFYPTARFLGRTEFLPHFWAVPLVAAISLGVALWLGMWLVFSIAQQD